MATETLPESSVLLDMEQPIYQTEEFLRPGIVHICHGLPFPRRQVESKALARGRVASPARQDQGIIHQHGGAVPQRSIALLRDHRDWVEKAGHEIPRVVVSIRVSGPGDLHEVRVDTVLSLAAKDHYRAFTFGRT